MTTITIDHLYRVEGHGGIQVTVGPDGVESCEMDIFEGARFYEALLKGRHYAEVPGIICRVCAICSAGHTLCSLRALEDALGIMVDPEVQRFRDLLNLGQIIESHALHLFCLIAPDETGFSSILAMADRYPDEVHKGLEIKRAGNRIQEVVGGRAIHPVNMIVGGIGRRPSLEEMEPLIATLEAALAYGLSLEGFMSGPEVPDFGLQPTTYVALQNRERYALRGEALLASGREPVPVAEFHQLVNERVVAHSTAKQAFYEKKPFMVGAVARLVHNGSLLGGEAGRLYHALIPEAPNPLHNNRAQFVELVWCLEQALELTRELAGGHGPIPCAVPSEDSGKRGVAALEVPRGTLFHAYVLDADGCVSDADVITPTAQNLANIEKDFYHAVGQWLEGAGRDESLLKMALERIARAYDPCISCSTHLVDLSVRKS